MARILTVANCVVVWLAAVPAFPGTYIVSTTADSGLGSLRQAIRDANLDGGGEIVFSHGHGTITLLTPLPVIGTGVRMLGMGPAKSIVSGNNTNRVFNIRSGATVFISGLTICDGRTADGTNWVHGAVPAGQGNPGGGILNAGTLVISNCFVCNNRTGSGVPGVSGRDEAGLPGNGGGIYSSGPLTVLSCTFSNNVTGMGAYAWDLAAAGSSGGDGGGIWSGGTLVVSNSIMAGNATGVGGRDRYDGAGPGNGGRGAGIFAVDPVLVSHCTLSNNVTGDGGRGEAAGGHGGAGGGIFASGALTADTSTLNGNSTGAGGVAGDLPGGNGGDGAAIYSAGPLNVSNCTLKSNSTGRGGNSNYRLAGGGGAGGAIYAVYVGGALTLSDCQLSGNRTGQGGDGDQGGGGKGGQGGGIYSAGVLTVSNCMVNGNRTGDGGRNPHGFAGGNGGDGGGIFSSRTMTLLSCALSNNLCGSGGAGDSGVGGGSKGGSGGGIHSAGGLSLTGCSLRDNICGGGGGAAYGGSGGSGGAMCVSNSLAMDDCTLSGNRSGAGGSGRLVGGAGGPGGAVYLAGLSAAKNCTLNGNRTGLGGTGTNQLGGNGGSGAGIFNLGSLTLNSCTISRNTTAPGGGGLTNGLTGVGGGVCQVVVAGSARVLNTIIAVNTKPTLAPDDASGAFSSLGWNLLGSTSGSSGFGVPGDRLNIDPQLGPLADNGGPTWTCALLARSPAIDAGATTGVPPTDQRGVTRPQRLGVDIGAYEAEYRPLIFSQPRLLSGTSFWFQCSGELGESYYLQASTNLITWITLTYFAAGANGVWEYMDRDMRFHPRRFYRLSLQPTASPIHLPATLGVLSGPFIVESNYIYQPHLTGVTNGGRALYPFTITNAGNYVLVATVNAQDEGANSFFVNIDAEPQDPDMICDTPITSGFADVLVSWRGHGTPELNEFVPKVFTLTAGGHQLIIRGRESFTLLRSIAVVPAGE